MHGIGTDLVEIARIASLYQRFGDRFAKRILSEPEYAIFERQHYSIPFLAKRFAGKEAVAKALGTGIGEQVAFTEISITNHQNGKPVVELLGKAAKLLHKLAIKEIMISLSDEKHYALAFAVAS
jgi:holo-[acyl-carrier protein] synthase